MLLVITGKKRVGKDTMADYLVSDKWKFIKAPTLASPFKDFAKECFGWTDEYVESHKEDIDPNWGFSPREFYQVFGNEIMKEDLSKRIPLFGEMVGKNIWVNVFIRRFIKLKNAFPNVNFVLTDMRFMEEYEMIKRLSTVLNYSVRFVRVESTRKEALHFDEHISEHSLDKVPFSVIRNDGSIEDFYKNIDDFMKGVAI